MAFATPKTALIVLALAGLPIAACSTMGTDTGMGEPSGTASASETAAMAATFRYMFANNASAIKANAATYCIGTGRKPNLDQPSPELLAALSDVQPRVSPASACRMGDRATDASGRPALIFGLQTIRCDGADMCLFQGGYYEGNMSASGGRYRAQRTGNTWQVQPDGPQAIS